MTNEPTIEDALAYAKTFRSPRSEYTPGAIPWIDDELAPPQPSLDPKLKSLRDQEERVRGKTFLSNDEITFVLQLADERTITASLRDHVELAIRQQSKLFQKRDEIKKLADVHAPTVDWNVALPPQIYARYYADTNRIALADAEPSDHDSIQSLARLGVPHTSLNSLTHERTHSVQNMLGGGITIPAELREIQAYRAQIFRRKGKNSIYLTWPHESLVDDFIGNSTQQNKFDPRKLNSAVYSIDRLNALGSPQAEIVQLISNAGPWNKQIGFWENIQAAIEKERRSRGINQEGLERLVMAADLEKSIATYNARAATQQVLAEVFAKDLKDRRVQQLFSTRSRPRPPKRLVPVVIRPDRR